MTTRSLLRTLAPAAVAALASGCGGSSTPFTTLKPVITTSCALSSSCHDNKGKMGGLDLKTDPWTALVGQPTMTTSQWPHLDNLAKDYPTLVTPGDPLKSALWVKLNMNTFVDSGSGATPYGFGMPQQTMPLDAATLAEWKSWISGGALND